MSLPFVGPARNFAPLLPSEWNSIPALAAGGVASVASTNENIAVDSPIGNVEITLASDLQGLNSIQVESLVAGGTIFPTAVGSVGYVLTMGADDTAAWQPSGGGPGGAVDSVSTLNANLTCTPTTGDVVVDIVATPTFSGITATHSLVVGDLTFPAADATAGYVVTTDGLGNLSLQPGGGGPGGAVDSVSTTNANLLISPTTGDVVIDFSPGPTFEDVTATTSLVAGALTYPTVDAAAGYVVMTDGLGNLTLQPNGGGGGSVDSVAASGINIVVSPETGPVTVALADDITLTSVSAGTITVTGEYSLPTAIGADGDVLSVNNVGAVVWAAQTPTFVTGTTNEISVTDNVISLPATLVVPGSMTMGGNLYPESLGVAGQFLQTAGDGTLSWADGGAAGSVTSVTGSTNIICSPETGNVIVSLNSTLIEVTSLETGSLVAGGNTYPENAGSPGDVLQTNGAGVLSWSAAPGSGVDSVASANSLIGVSSPTGAITLTANLNPTFTSVTATTATLGGVELPTATGTPGEVLSISTAGHAAWSTAGVSGISSLTAGANLAVSAPTGAVTVSLDTAVTTASVSAAELDTQHLVLHSAYPTLLPSIEISGEVIGEPAILVSSGGALDAAQTTTWVPQVRSATYDLVFDTEGSPLNVYPLRMTFERMAGSNTVTWVARVATNPKTDYLIHTTTTSPLISTASIDPYFIPTTIPSITQIGMTCGSCWNAAGTTLSGLRQFVFSVDLDGYIYIYQYQQNSHPFSFSGSNCYVVGSTFQFPTGTDANCINADVCGSYFIE